MRLTSRAETKVGCSDPQTLCGKVCDQRISATCSWVKYSAVGRGLNNEPVHLIDLGELNFHGSVNLLLSEEREDSITHMRQIGNLRCEAG